MRWTSSSQNFHPFGTTLVPLARVTTTFFKTSLASYSGRSDNLLLANTTDGAHVELEEDGTVVRRQEVYCMILGGAFHGLSHGGVLQPYPLKDSAYQNLSEI